jgi:peptide alpha-N-acetyltransferase
MANDTDCLTSNDHTTEIKNPEIPAEGRQSSAVTDGSATNICMAATSESEGVCVRNVIDDVPLDQDTTNGTADPLLPNGCVKGLHVCNNNTGACDKPTADLFIAANDTQKIDDSRSDFSKLQVGSNTHTPDASVCSNQDAAITPTADVSISSVSMDDSGTADLLYIPPCGIASGSVSCEQPKPSNQVPASGTTVLEVTGGFANLSVAPRVPCSEDAVPTSGSPDSGIEYVIYKSEQQMDDIMQLITKDLSEPYSIYTYRYFIHNWPRLCFLAMDKEKCVGAIVCKLDRHKTGARRGYIAMLAVDHNYRKLGIGSNLVVRAIRSMMSPASGGCDEVVLETEISNSAALHLYEKLGFVRDKRLFRYYLNGVDALRLKLWLR